jgi:predicted Fe-Mo cluster-binding NifX family protein
VKVAVSSLGKDLTSMMDPRFGRAPYLIIKDIDDGTLELIDNTSARDVAHGAGIQTAQAVVNACADVVVSGNYGPKAAQVLETAGIKLMVGPRVAVGRILELAEKSELKPFGEEVGNI